MKKIEKVINKIIEKQKNKKKERKYRLAGKHLFLTYSQCDLKREEILEQLKEKLSPNRIEKYVISTEKHEKEGEHIHVYLRLNNICDIRSSKRLDVEKEGERVHGNYQTCRSYNKVIGYIVKGGKENILTNVDLDDLGREVNIWKNICKINREQEVIETLKKIEEIAPRLMVTDYVKIKKALIEMKGDSEKKKKQIYDVKSFKIPKEVQEYRLKDLYEKTLYLSGSSGAGKTEMVKSIFAEEFGEENIIRTNNIEGLRKLGMKKYKGIILDDLDVTNMTVENLIGLMDVKNDHEQRILYGTVEIPTGMPRAFISNKKLEDLKNILGIPVRQMEALLRRCVNVDLGNKRVILRMELEIDQKEEEK